MVKDSRKKPTGAIAMTTQLGSPESRRKQIASPVSTGDRGGSFERRVQAVRLLAMCLGMQCPGAREGFVITELLFQGRLFDHDTDDLVIELVCPRTGRKATQRLQMKRSLQAGSNKTFLETVGLAWEDFSKPGFRRQLDQCVIVCNISSSSQMQGAVEVISSAVSSRAAEDWMVRVQTEGFSNAKNRAAFEAIKEAVELQKGSAVTADDLYEFSLHLKFMFHDLDSDRTGEVLIQKQLISQRISRRVSGDVWASLVGVCTELNGTAGHISEKTAERHMGALAEEFQTARAVWEGLHALQSAKYSGFQIAGLQPSALSLSAEAHSQLLALAELLQPLLPPGPGSQSGQMVEALPAAKADSTDSFFSRQLDRLALMQREHRFQECLVQLKHLEEELSAFDNHQKARWYLLRGVSLWHMGDDAAAADDFDVAVELYDADDRIAAAGVRAKMLRGQPDAAVATGLSLLKRFPESFFVWVATTNARLMSGQLIQEDDVPEAFQGMASAWQMVACSYAGADDDEGAVRAILVAMEKPDSSVFIVETYLRYALRLATLDTVRVNCRAILPEHAKILADAISRFDDRNAGLWAIQSPKILADAVGHLAYGMVLLQQPTQALELLQQARVKGIPSTEVMTRVEIESLSDLNRWEDVTERFQGELPSLPEDSILRFAHACLAQSRSDLLRLTRDELARRTPSDSIRHVGNMLRHLHWDLLLQTDELAVIRQELEQTGVTPHSQFVVDLYFAARAYQDDEAIRNLIEDRVAELAPVSSDPQELAMGARVMIHARRYDDAIGLLEKLLPADAFTPLHVDLLRCYNLTSRQPQARDLLESMPSTWLATPEAREQAMFLYNSVGDWPRMLDVIGREIADNPKDAGRWLTRIRISACANAHGVKAAIAELPDQLEGETKELLLLASIELRQGQAERGMDRIAFAMRDAQGDVETAATHVQVMLIAFDEMAQIYQTVEVVTAGTAVELEDAQGVGRFITIDFEGLPPSKRSAEIISADSDFAKQLIGLGVGDTAPISSLMGVQVLKVKQIITLHRRLLDLSHTLVRESVVPSKTLVSMTFQQTADGEMDMSYFHERMIEHQAQHTKVLELYETHPVSLGLVARRLGRDVIDLVHSWPLDGPWLDVSGGHEVIPSSFKRSPMVVDLSMLVELARLGLLDVLESLSAVYVSTATRQALNMKFETLGFFLRSSAVDSDDEEPVSERETATSQLLTQTLLRSIDLAITSYCIVVPAYGPREPSPLLQRLGDILDVEAQAALMLSLQYGASLLTLDGRLRHMAGALSIASASPQMVLHAALGNGRLRPQEYSCALINMVIAHRSFVSLNKKDLISMMDQGLDFATAGINGLRSYLALPMVEFQSAAATTIDFICEMYVTGRCTFGMLLVLTRYLTEPLLRHPDCPSQWRDSALRNFTPLRLHNFTATHYAFIARALSKAQVAARGPGQLVSIDAEVVHIGVGACYSQRYDSSGCCADLFDPLENAEDAEA